MKLLGFLSLLVILVIAFFGYVWWQGELRPVQQGNSSIVTLVVQPDQSAAQTLDQLASSHLIKSPLSARLYLKFTGLDQKIRPGSYELSPGSDLSTIFKELTSGPKDIKITIPEGWRREQIAIRLQADLPGFDSSEFLRQTASLEGQLFPDTYLIPPSASVSDVIHIFTSNFSAKTHLDPSLASDRQTLVIASMVEREALSDADRPTIAGILIKRLAAGMNLELDTTAQYAWDTLNCRKSPLTCKYWTQDYDFKVESLYNTYLHPGLPPGPISNPGLASITGAQHPQSTAYWFFLAGHDGITHYAQTLAGQNLNVDKYLHD